MTKRIPIMLKTDDALPWYTLEYHPDPSTAMYYAHQYAKTRPATEQYPRYSVNNREF